jgi:dihydrofolate synthase/folylpolyglutamate synthase
MLTDYQETLNYLYDSLPMFQRVGIQAYKADLSNTIQLCDAIGNPQRTFKTIHVAGTNGKGSTSHMLASVLQSAGYRVGLYTSPHLKSFTERIRINGKEIEEHAVVDFVNAIRSTIEEIHPSFFEITVAMAFHYFAQQKVDIAVIEVGLGGRLDSTNLITPEVSVITNIGWDHKDILGDTLQKIAAEKAGIIKPQIPVVISEQQSEIDQVFIEKANIEHAPLYFATDDVRVIQHQKDNTFVYDVYIQQQLVLNEIAIPLQGRYQQKNLGGVLKCLHVLQTQGWTISLDAIRHGLEYVVSQTGLKGRWQKLGINPLIICDTGHNIDGIKEVVQQISQQKFDKLHMVIGMVSDKDIREVLAALPKRAHYYFCQAKIPRALPAETLASLAAAVGLNGDVIPSVPQAIDAALSNATEDDLIFIGGSTFVVAEIENL